jgi:hypothetical protein
MHVDIVIISYSGGQLLNQAIESIHRFKNCIDANIIVQQAKQSIPLNVNAGFSKVTSDWWVLFNDDWEAMEDNWLDRLYGFTDDGIGFVSCRVVFDTGLLNHCGYFISENGKVGNKGKNKPDQVLPDEFIKYAHPILINSKMFKELGGYDEGFEGSQYADIDFVYRVSKQYKIFFAGSVPLLHHYGHNKSTNAVRERVKKRNEAKFRAKHGFKKRFGYQTKQFGRKKR